MLKLDYYLQRQDYSISSGQRNLYKTSLSLAICTCRIFSKIVIWVIQKKVLCASLLGECSIRLCCSVVLCKNCICCVPAFPFSFFDLKSREWIVYQLLEHKETNYLCPKEEQTYSSQTPPHLLSAAAHSDSVFWFLLNPSEQCRELSFQQLPWYCSLELCIYFLSPFYQSCFILPCLLELILFSLLFMFVLMPYLQVWFYIWL